MALASLICGLVSFLLIPFFPAIAALVLGIMGRNRIKQYPQYFEGDAYAVVGIILGATNLFAVIVGALLLVVSLVSRSGF